MSVCRYTYPITLWTTEKWCSEQLTAVVISWQYILFANDYTIYLESNVPPPPSEKLCIEDYIALQEMIVPIVVGGVLGLLLALIFVAYILAYIRRRRKEARSAQYEPVSDY